MKLSIPAGTTSKRIAIFIQDSSSTTGAGLAALAYNTGSLTCYSWIDTDGNAGGTVQALQTATLGTWTTRGFVKKDDTNMPGMYEFGIPDALLASGVKWAIVYFKGAANMAPLVLEIEVTAVSNQDAVRGGMTALPNAAPAAVGGLLTGPTTANTGLADVTRLLGTAVSTPATAGILDVNVKNIDNDAASASGTVTFPNATLASTTNITAGVITTVGTLTTYTGNTPQTGDAFARIGAAGVSLSAIPDLAGLTTLLSRLSSARAGYLDNLSAGAAALEASVQGLNVLQAGTAASGSTSGLVLQTALGANSLPEGCILRITAGAGAKQARGIISYVDSTKAVVFDRVLAVAADNTSVYSIVYANSPAVTGALRIGLVEAVTDLINPPFGMATSGELAAVRAKTDQLVFTVTNQIDANVLDWKSATAPAMTGDAFARIGAAGVGLTGVGIGTGGIASTAFAAGAIDAAAIATDAIGSAELAASAATEIVTAIFARAFSAAYGSLTFDQLTSLMAAALLAKCSGMATTSGVFRNLADSADTISATIDANGNRTAVSLTP